MNNIVMISGATSGIGLATARLFAENNYDLILIGRREDRLSDVRKELESKHEIKVLPLVLDVRNSHAVDREINGLDDPWKNIDVLVNNAGLAVGMGPLHEGDIDDWDRMIDTNIKGLLYLSRLVIPIMINKRQGHIINIGSIAGKQTYMNGNVYCATKHAVDALTQSMRMELLSFGIRVSQVAPGAVETEFSEVRFKGDVKKATAVYKGYTPLSPEDVAEAVYFVASRPAHVCINDLLVMPTAQADTVHWKKEL